jgi:hypothetical protein
MINEIKKAAQQNAVSKIQSLTGYTIYHMADNSAIAIKNMTVKVHPANAQGTWVELSGLTHSMVKHYQANTRQWCTALGNGHTVIS